MHEDEEARSEKVKLAEESRRFLCVLVVRISFPCGLFFRPPAESARQRPRIECPECPSAPRRHHTTHTYTLSVIIVRAHAFRTQQSFDLINGGKLRKGSLLAAGIVQDSGPTTKGMLPAPDLAPSGVTRCTAARQQVRRRGRRRCN